MKRLVIFFFTLVLTFKTAFAQKQRLTLEDCFLNPALQPQSLRQLQWIPGTDQFTWVETVNKTELLLAGNARNNKVDTLLKPVQLQEKLNRFPAITWKSKSSFYYQFQNKLFLHNTETDQSVALVNMEEGAENIDIEKNSFAVAYTLENNLFLKAGMEQHIVSKETDPGVVAGQSVHRNEFGINKGTFWSNSGNKLAFYRMDQSMVTDYPLVDIGTQPAKVRNIKYPMAGQKSHHVTVGVYDLKSKLVVYLQTGEPKEQYLTNISWMPGEKHLTMAVLNREQNHMKLNQYDVETGQLVKTLFEEKHEKYVEPEHAALFVDNNRFIWQSERDGFNHLYLYDLSGKLLRQLTRGSWVVTEVYGLDEANKFIYYRKTKANGLERRVARVELASGKELEYAGDGMVSGIVQPEGKYCISITQNPKTPRQYNLLDAGGKQIRQVFDAKNPLANYDTPLIEYVSLSDVDGTPLHGRILRPANIEAGKKLPVIVYLYGGPHLQLVNKGWHWGVQNWMLYAAQQGYVVFSVDNKGSSDRGRDFEQATFRQLGTAEMGGQLQAVKYLKSLPFVDSTRMGVNGWSFGGFLTTTLLTRNPGTFKAGVAGGPVIDWSMYEVMYTERYMDTPEENPEGYANSNLTQHAKNLKDKLLMIHGTADDVVVWQHSQAFLKKCVSEGVQLEYFIYPGHPHNVGGKDRVHLFRKILDYFDLHLK
jgi:dipeptidyl-peptidase-4